MRGIKKMSIFVPDSVSPEMGWWVKTSMDRDHEAVCRAGLERRLRTTLGERQCESLKSGVCKSRNSHAFYRQPKSIINAEFGSKEAVKRILL